MDKPIRFIEDIYRNLDTIPSDHTDTPENRWKGCPCYYCQGCIDEWNMWRMVAVGRSKFQRPGIDDNKWIDLRMSCRPLKSGGFDPDEMYKDRFDENGYVLLYLKEEDYRHEEWDSLEKVYLSLRSKEDHCSGKFLLERFNDPIHRLHPNDR